MRYVYSRYAYEQRELSYRIYISDCLYYQGENKRPGIRFADRLTEKVKEDTRTGDDIVLDIMSKFDLKG